MIDYESCVLVVVEQIGHSKFSKLGLCQETDDVTDVVAAKSPEKVPTACWYIPKTGAKRALGNSLFSS